MKLFTFLVRCHDGQYEAKIKAPDEPHAWTELTRVYVLRDVRSIELQFDLSPTNER